MISQLPNTKELLAVAKATAWFKSPEEALQWPEHLIAHVLTYGTHDHVATLRRYVSDDQLLAALVDAPPGIYDSRSWAYWHVVLGKCPPPPLPTRNLDHVVLPGVRSEAL